MHVINSIDPLVTVNDRGEDEYAWVGDDDRGVGLEITGVVVEDDLLLVIHVMPTQFRREP